MYFPPNFVKTNRGPAIHADSTKLVTMMGGDMAALILLLTWHIPDQTMNKQVSKRKTRGTKVQARFYSHVEPDEGIITGL